MTKKTFNESNKTRLLQLTTVGGFATRKKITIDEFVYIIFKNNFKVKLQRCYG